MNRACTIGRKEREDQNQNGEVFQEMYMKAYFIKYFDVLKFLLIMSKNFTHNSK